MRDRLILAAAILVLLAGTLGYYELFQGAAKATLFIAKVSLFLAAILAAFYSLITVIAVYVLLVSHLVDALRRPD